MPRGVTVLVGTKKGAYRFKSGAARERWRMIGHDFSGQPVYHLAFDPRDGKSLFAAINATWGGPRIEVSRDLGVTWKTAKNPAFSAGSPLTFSRTWHIEPSHASDPSVVWCGTEPAALFRSEDRGMTWEGVAGLNDHPERVPWSPGGGGLGLHSIAIDAADPRSMMIGISAAGVYESRDGGATWASANKGSKAVLPVSGETNDLGRCVHHLVVHPTVAGARFQQNHVGTYFNAGNGWRNVTTGLPGDYGIRRGDPPARCGDRVRLPARGPDADERRRRRGVPDDRCREALDPSGARPSARRSLRGHARGARHRSPRSGGGVLRDDERGLWGSADGGRGWRRIAEHLPPILSLEAATA